MPDAPPKGKNGDVQAEATPVNTAVTAFSIMNVQTWSDQALSQMNSIAGVVAFVAGVVLLLSLGFLYVSGSALSSRLATSPESAGSKAPRPVETAAPPRNGSNGEKASVEDQRKVERLTKELTEARLAVEARRADMARLQRELAEAQKSDKTKTERVARLENDFETVKRSEQEKSSRVAQLEEQLGRVQKTEAERNSKLAQLEEQLGRVQKTDTEGTSRLAQLEEQLGRAQKTDAERAARLAQLEKDLETARQASAEKTSPAFAAAAQLPVTGTSRAITGAQREQFLHAVQGRATGKVLVSAFFENKETHDFGNSVIALLKAAGFEVIEQAPVNFFTTSRPSSGMRIGCENMAHPPKHFSTVRSGFEAMGIEIPDASVVNAQTPDVVEIQITPRE